MIRYLKLCYPCAMRLDLFYKYRLQRPGEPLEHLKERLTIAEQDIPNCDVGEERQCWSRFLDQLVGIWEDHVQRLRVHMQSSKGFTISVENTTCLWSDGSTDCEDIPYNMMRYISGVPMYFEEDINLSHLEGKLEGDDRNITTTLIGLTSGKKCVFTIHGSDVYWVSK